MQRAHELQMQAAKGEDEKKLKAEEEVFKKEKHGDAAEIYKTLARQEGYGSIGVVNNSECYVYVDNLRYIK